MRTGIPKYSGVWSLLAALEFLGLLIQRHIGWEGNRLIGNLGGLCLAGAMAVMFAGMIADRKAEEMKQKPEQPR